MTQDGQQDRPHWEPPPWEADAFDAMKRRRAAEEADAEISAAIDGLEAAPIAPPPPVPEVQPVVPAPAPPAPAPAPVPAPAAPDPRVDEMMFRLKAEEPASTRGTWIFAASVALVSGMFGLVLVTWGLVAFGKTGRVAAGALGSGILLLFGCGFVALAAWMLRKALKLKGVV